MYSEDFEHEEFGVSEPAGLAFHGFDLVVGAFQRARRDGVVVPSEDAPGVEAEGLGELLQVDDGRELTSFCIASPHFCRKKRRDGTWHDNVYLTQVGDNRTGWGWFYYGEQQSPNTGQLKLSVPDCRDKSGETILSSQGQYLAENTIEWDPQLCSEVHVDFMKEINKSQYRVALQKGEKLLSHGKTNMWFRLIVEPVELDIPRPLPPSRDRSLIDKIFPALNLTAAA